MSRAWIAFYMGDYARDTAGLSTLEHGAYFLLLQECWVHGKIPQEPARRANIAKLTLREWNKVAPVVNQFFDEEGCNNRATKEIAKAEHVRVKRAIAGQRGGLASGISKAKRIGEQTKPPSKYEAIANQIREQSTEQIPKPSVPNHNSKIINTSSVSAREGPLQASPELLASLSRKITA